MAIRKNYRCLTDVERDRFIQALYRVKSTGVVDQLADIHARHFSMGIHTSSHFLPWHREMLLRFERELQKFHPEITIPYWDSSIDHSSSDPLWDNIFLGQFNSVWGLNRSLGSSNLPTSQEVDTNQQRGFYNEFWPELESVIHNAPHRWVGGTMASTASPGDPVFYLHHCWIDLLWAKWQITHRGTPFVSSGIGLGLNDPLMEWPDRTPADVLDHHALGYTYDSERAGFGNLADGRPLWIGKFSRSDRAEVLFYFPGDDNWWLGSHDGNQLQWTLAGNTAGFGHAINDGRPFWIGNFSRSDRAEVLFYFPGDDNWWLGSHDGNQLQWTPAGNTAGFGHGINDGRPFWIGNFSRSDRAEVLFYFPGDDNWWLGTHDGTQLNWSFAGNTAGFGHGINDGRPFWIGNFSRSDRAEVLFYFPGDGNWWLGSHDGNQLQWTHAGNTLGDNPGDPNFGQVSDGRPFWVGDLNGDGRAEILFYFPGDGNWWRGSHQGLGGKISWSFAGNTGHTCR